MISRRSAGVALALALLVGVVPVALAKSSRVVSHPYERVWPAAVRFLRVDAQLKILERDEEAGYVLFEIVSDRKTFTGSMELIRTEDDDRRPATRVVITIAGRPSYVEDALLERLEAKLREELGEPPPPPPPPPAEPKAASATRSFAPRGPAAQGGSRSATRFTHLAGRETRRKVI